MADLRKASTGTQLSWTKEQLRAGFSYFKELNGRYPTAHEIDTFPIYHPLDQSRGLLAA